MTSKSFSEKNESGAWGSYKKVKIKTHELYLKKYDDLKLNVKPIFVKIDVEGLELLVLQGLVNLIKNNRIFLQIEIFDQEFVKTSSFLEEHNFKLIEKGTFTHQDTVKDYFYINF